MSAPLLRVFLPPASAPESSLNQPCLQRPARVQVLMVVAVRACAAGGGFGGLVLGPTGTHMARGGFARGGAQTRQGPQGWRGLWFAWF